MPSLDVSDANNVAATPHVTAVENLYTLLRHKARSHAEVDSKYREIQLSGTQ